MSKYVGIDPGLSGGIAVIGSGLGSIEVHRTPVQKIKTKKRIDEEELDNLLSYLIEDSSRVILEGISGIPPTWGASSSCYYGVSYGIALGMAFSLCQFYSVPLIVVPPKTWKKEILGGVTNDKGMSLQVAKRMFPEVAATIGKHDGMAEALLLAEYGRRLG